MVHMLQADIASFVYFSSQKNTSGNSTSQNPSEKIDQVLKTIAKQVIKEKIPSLQDLEMIFQADQESLSKEQVDAKSEGQLNIFGSNEPLTKSLKKLGYLKDEKKWLTNKAFFEIGQKMLEDVIKAINEGGLGLHETKNIGFGNTILDTSRKLERGDEMTHLNIPHTILNAIQRKKSRYEQPTIPISLELSDFEKFETKEDVKAALVYCIDLSSTMKYSLNSGEGSRIESAKKALWALYVLNKKFFPNDSVYIIGFGSLASQVSPHDIPYLKTYDANDSFLHYTNYQAAFRIALKILKKDGSQNKRIVMITDGQPSACFVDDESQKSMILSDKPYSHFYRPDEVTLSKIKNEKDVKLDAADTTVYLCYRYRQVDPIIELRTLQEAKKCKREGIEIDTIMVSEETELLNYVENLEKNLKGRAYYINPEKIDQVLISDFISNKKRIFNSRRGWQI